MSPIHKFFLAFGRIIQYLMSIGLYVQIVVVYSLAAFPSIYLTLEVLHYVESQQISTVGRALIYSFLLFGALACFGICLCLLVPLCALLTFSRLKEGEHSFYSPETVKWATYNAWILMVRFTVMDYMKATPFLPLFLKAMGAKIGKNVQVNTSILGDVCLLEIGDNVVVGGDCTLICHSVENGKLIMKSTKIGKNVTLGLMSCILPGVEIGENSSIGANSVVPKNTIIPPGEVWAGIPAQCVRKKNTPDPHYTKEKKE
jgi:acetyltransferase-like isoleucine patch superfamily enzyme